MSIEPLKNKWHPAGCSGEYCDLDFKKEDIKSAIEWLKQEIKNKLFLIKESKISREEKERQYEILEWSYKKIAVAFSDVVKK